MTVDQACRLLFSSGSKTYVRDKLGGLFAAGYLARDFIPKKDNPYDRVSWVYLLASRGLTYLRDAGVPVSSRFRREQASHSYRFYTHTLSVNDVLIAAERL